MEKALQFQLKNHLRSDYSKCYQFSIECINNSLSEFFPFIGLEMMMNPNTNANGEDLMTLEAEITELQRENARVESQMLRLKSDITAMESQLGNDRVRNLVL